MAVVLAVQVGSAASDAGGPTYVASQRIQFADDWPRRTGCACLREHRAARTKERLIIPFAASSCCTSGPGLLDKELPVELERTGVSSREWDAAVLDLTNRVQPRGCSATAIILAIIPHFWPIALVPVCCMEARYHSALRVWLAALNRDVLVPRGLLGALQSATHVAHVFPMPLEGSWLAISLTQDDALSLAQEPMMWTSSGCPTCGCPRDTLVPHPRQCCVRRIGCCCVPCAV